MSEAPAADEAPSRPKPPAGRWRRVLARTLTVIGILLAIIALFANFVRTQLLDTDEFKQTAALLIESEPIRDQVAATLVDELYNNVDVKDEIEEQLPEDVKGLSGLLAAGSRELAERAAQLLLDRPRIQELWVETLGAAHEELVLILEGGGDVVSTSDGEVVLDLRELVVRLGEEVGVGGEVADRVPESAAQIEILQSDELKTAQDAVTILDAVALWLWVLALAAWALAVWLARGYRRYEVRAIAVGLLIVGVGVLLLRTLGGNYLVGELATTESVKPAAEDAWNIITRLLKDQAWTVIILGIFALAGTWFAGPGGMARSAREALAPYIKRPEIAYGAYGVVALILLWWGPTGQWRDAISVIVMIALGALGVEAIRRVTAHDFPDAVATDVWGAARSKMDEWSGALRDTRRAATSPQETVAPDTAPQPPPPTPVPAPAAPAPPTRDISEQLTALAALRDQGALTEEEFAAAKKKLLG